MFDAVRYADNAAFSEVHARKFLNYSKDYFKWNKSEEILEIGCADGKLTKSVLYPFIEKHLGYLYGADRDDEAITRAKVLLDTGNVTFTKMDAEDEESACANKDRFDHIFAFYLLHWVSINMYISLLYMHIKKTLNI